jgi:hypothetical protein
MFPRQDGCARDFPFRGNVGRRASETSPCRRTGNAKRRAQPPRGNDWQPDRRRGNRDPRTLLLWPGCPSRRLQLVFTRSSGRNSLSVVAAIKVAASEGGLLQVRWWFFGHRPGGQSKPSRVRQVPQRDDEGRCPTRKSRRLRSSFVPQFAVQLPRPGRRFVMVAPIGWFIYRCFHLSRVQELFDIESHLLVP